MKKKLLGLFLSAIMLLTSSATAFAAGNGIDSATITSKNMFGEAIVEVTKNPSGLVDVVIVNSDANTDKDAFLESENKYFSSDKYIASVDDAK